MKKIIITTLLRIATLPLSAQATTPLSLGERSEVRLLSLNQLKDSALRNNIAIRKAYHNIHQLFPQREWHGCLVQCKQGNGKDGH